MQLRTRLLTALAISAVCVIGLGAAQAQPAGGTPPAGGSGTPGGAATTQAGSQRTVTLSIDEVKKQASEAVNRVSQVSDVIRKMLEKARTDKDSVKILCLDDKLNQIDALVRSAGPRKQSLDGAAQTRNEDLVKHEYTILSEYKKQADKLLGEANQCVGSELTVVTDTSITSSVDPTLPDDSTGPGGSVIILFDPPPPTSSSEDM